MRIGFTCGVFDLFHAGHVLMLKECKDNCDFLIVGLNTAENISSTINPGKRKPVYSIQERKIIMESCRYVDEVMIYDSEEALYDFMRSRKIDVRFLGEDYKGKPITGSDLGFEIYYTDRSHGLSTTAVINKILANKK